MASKCCGLWIPWFHLFGGHSWSISHMQQPKAILAVGCRVKSGPTKQEIKAEHGCVTNLNIFRECLHVVHAQGFHKAYDSILCIEFALHLTWPSHIIHLESEPCQLLDLLVGYSCTVPCDPFLLLEDCFWRRSPCGSVRRHAVKTWGRWIAMSHLVFCVAYPRNAPKTIGWFANRLTDGSMVTRTVGPVDYCIVGCLKIGYLKLSTGWS